MSGGKIFTYAAGTTTPQTTFTSRTGLTANTNPIILDSAGRTPEQIWATEGVLYKYVVKDANDVEIRTWDNIGGSVVASDLAQDLADNSDPTKGDALIGFRQSNPSGNLTGAVGRTVHQKLQETISVKDFGAVGDGVTDDTVAIQTALDAMPNDGGVLLFPTGRYIVSAPLILPAKSSDRLKPIYICGESSSIAPENIGTRIVYTATSGSLFEGRGASGTDTRRAVMAFRDIQLYGQYATGVGSTNTSTGINLYGATNFHMDNVLIQGFKYGLSLTFFWFYSKINYCRFRLCEYGVYSVSGLANGSAFTNCSFTEFDENAMYLQASVGEALYISQCWFEAAQGDQIRLLSTGRKIVVRDSYFEYSGTGYAVNWIRENDPVDKTFQLVFDGNIVSCASSANAVIFANNANPNPQTTAVTISNINCLIGSSAGATQFLRQDGATGLMSVVFLNEIVYNRSSGGVVLPPTLSRAARYEESLEGTRIGEINPELATFRIQYLKSAASIYSYDTQELTNYKTDVSNGVAFDIFEFDKLGAGGASSTDYVSCGGILEISYCAQRSDAGTARVATERIPINLGSFSSNNIALATETPVITAAVPGTACTIALSLSATSSTSATLACTLTIGTGTLGPNDLMFRLKVTNAADSNSRIMAVSAV
jgi:hypothetical protein